jgi:hypothetical protein
MVNAACSVRMRAFFIATTEQAVYDRFPSCPTTTAKNHQYGVSYTIVVYLTS